MVRGFRDMRKRGVRKYIMGIAVGLKSERGYSCDNHCLKSNPGTEVVAAEHCLFRNTP